jgi:hypothetical protein
VLIAYKQNAARRDDEEDRLMQLSSIELRTLVAAQIASAWSAMLHRTRHKPRSMKWRSSL